MIRNLIESGFRSDGAIVGEPSNREYAIVHRGLEWLEIEIIGKRHMEVYLKQV